MMSVSASFQKLLARIEPTSVETAKALAHAITIRTRLATSFSLKRFLTARSFARGTFIHIREIRKQDEAAEALDELRGQVEQTWDHALAGHVPSLIQKQVIVMRKP